MQIFNGIRDMILSGKMPAGYKLPPERKLADQLGVNRSTVINAYRELKSCGLVESHVGRGTAAAIYSTGDRAGHMAGEKAAHMADDRAGYIAGDRAGSSTGGRTEYMADDRTGHIAVSGAGRAADEMAGLPWDSPGKARHDASMIHTMPWDQLFSESSLRMQDTTVRDLLKLSGRKDMILFAAGVSVQGIDSLEDLQKIQAEVLNEQGHNAIKHVPSDGFYPLRESISRLAGSRGVNASAQDVMVLSGSQQGLCLAACAFIDPGDVVFVEEPTFFSAVHIFRAQGARIIGISVDRIKLIYTIPDFQNPSGRTWSAERRAGFMKLLAGRDILVVEDAPYSELRFEGDMLPPLKSLDTEGFVIYLGTFSKVFCPGMRIGWVAADEKILEKYVLVKQGADLHSAGYTQRIISMYMDLYELDDDISKICEVYKKRRDAMLEAISAELPAGTRFTQPKGGLFTWIELDGDIDTRELLAECLERNVAFVPGEPFFPNGGVKNTMRLNYSNMPEEKIAEGIRQIGTAIREMMSRQASWKDAKVAAS